MQQALFSLYYALNAKILFATSSYVALTVITCSHYLLSHATHMRQLHVTKPNAK